MAHWPRLRWARSTHCWLADPRARCRALICRTSRPGDRVPAAPVPSSGSPARPRDHEARAFQQDGQARTEEPRVVGDHHAQGAGQQEAAAEHEPAGHGDAGQGHGRGVAVGGVYQVLRTREGLSEQEIATTLGIPTGTVKSRLHRARAAFREVWES
ncbi:sigma factor-like helix-turn-helix DNA-binding protein [Nonomuraea sp. B19D2]|uniref:sigma factor-like helix-turn-helix DNA-binding protein n=1 Tax=Nonomuraea sp. B19D2 TaxID=3159561 RepID=UPI0032D9BCC3